MDSEYPVTAKPAMRVDVYSHHITVSGFEDTTKRALYGFFRGLGHYGLKKVAPRQFVRAITCTYATRTRDEREFRFHIHQLEDLLRHLDSNGFPRHVLEIVHHEMYTPATVDMMDNPERRPRDYQIPLIAYLAGPGQSKVITLQTGKGKSLIFLKACAQIAQRTALVIQGKFVEQWVEGVYNDYKFKKSDLMVVRGGADMRAMIDIALAGELTAKFIIITSGTLNNYYREYEESQPSEFLYNCHPEKLWEVLGVGVRGIDEVHMEFHRNFRADLYANVPKTISLSATLESDDSFIKRMYMIVWPAECRTEQLPFDQYINVVALEYQFTNPYRIRSEGVNKMYSQIALEQSIMRQKDVLKNFLKMVTDLVFDQFLAVFEYGQRCIVFACTVEMCDALLECAVRRFPDVSFGRYAASLGDQLKSISENDVTFSTLKSAGTAIDVPNLRTVIMTDSVDSVQSNQQAVGRLRRLKDWPDISPQFVYIYAGNNVKQRMYHERKKEKLKGRVKSHKTFITNYHI